MVQEALFLLQVGDGVTWAFWRFSFKVIWCNDGDGTGRAYMDVGDNIFICGLLIIISLIWCWICKLCVYVTEAVVTGDDLFGILIPNYSTS